MDIPARRVSLMLFCLLVFAWVARPAAADEHSTRDCERSAIPKSIVVAGVARTYLLYVPCVFQPHKSALIVGIHGRTGSAQG
jgi:poly(3-hydroxybutyrate) depolymerase